MSDRFQGYKKVTEEQIKKAEKSKKENKYDTLDLLKAVVESNKNDKNV